MELWVRSQTREKLIRVNNVSVFWENDWFIVANITNDLQEFKEVIVLGEYKSKERVLEVLDEIQEYINNNCEFIEHKSYTNMGTYTNKIETKVYEMPEE